MSTIPDIKSIEELAEFSAPYSLLFLAVRGDADGGALIQHLSTLMRDSESVIIVPEGSPLIRELGAPSQAQSLGAWSGKGALIGFQEPPESLEDFVVNCRRFA